MNTYQRLKAAIEGAGIMTSAIALPQKVETYAVIRMITHQPEQSADNAPTVYGAYMQVDLFTDSDADAKARRIINAATAEGFTYRGRSDDAQDGRQHVEIRLRILEVV